MDDLANTYRGQGASYLYFWKSLPEQDERFSHSSFSRLLNEWLKEIFKETKQENLSFFPKDLGISRIDLTPCPELNSSILNIHFKERHVDISQPLTIPDLPLLTPRQTFIVLGAEKPVEKAVVLQLRPAPGLFFFRGKVLLRPRIGYEIKVTKKNIFSFPWEDVIEKFILGKVGRKQINQNLGLQSTEEILTSEDIDAIKELCSKRRVKNDDPDCLSIQIILQAGDHLEVCVRESFSKAKKGVIEEISSKAKPLSAKEFIGVLNRKLASMVTQEINKFFRRSPLSQIVPRTNLVQDVGYKFKVTRGGPGGLTERQREDFKLRDMHPSYFGRLCSGGHPPE